MEHTSAGDALDQRAMPSAGGKLDDALDLLIAAFQDSRIDSITLTKRELLEQAVAAQRVLNTVWALQATRLAQAAAVEEVVEPDPTSPEGCRTHEVRHAIGAHQEEFIGSEIGSQFGWASGQANARVAEATDAITRTLRLFLRVGTGELEPAKLAAIHRSLGRVERQIDDDGTPVTRDLARAVENALLGDPDDAEAEQANVDRLARTCSEQARRRTARILASLDPVAARKAAERRRRDRIGVFAHPDDEPGLSHLHAILPSAVAAKVMAAIEKQAKELHADTRTNKTLAECRAHAIADLTLGNAHVTTQLVVQVPVHAGQEAAATSAAGSSFRASGDCPVPPGASSPTAFVHPLTGITVFPYGSPAAAGTTKTMSQDAVDRAFNELLKRMHPPTPDDLADWDLEDDYGPPDGSPQPHDGPSHPPPTDERSQEAPRSTENAAATAQLGDAVVPGIGIIPARVIEALSRSFGTTITRALVDATTGVTVETCETQYKPSARLQHFVRTRDVHCRFPGCSRAARWCDIDHLIPWPEGPTAADNLHCLCRHHHRTKQAHGWSVSMTPEGVCTWTSPSGRSYITTPGE